MVLNKTNYDTAQLLKIFNECLIMFRWQVDEVTIKYHKSILNRDVLWVGGYAPVGGRWIVLKLPEPDNWLMKSNIGELQSKSALIATVFLHEIGHLIKVKHNIGLTIEHHFENEIKAVFTDEKFPVNKNP
jgi:hypothetical protein